MIGNLDTEYHLILDRASSHTVLIRLSWLVMLLLAVKVLTHTPQTPEPSSHSSLVHHGQELPGRLIRVSKAWLVHCLIPEPHGV